MRFPNSTIPLVLSLVLLAGCAGTPTSRMADKQAVVASWPAEITAKVKAGQVEPGFNKEQVYVALGAADRAYTRQTAEGRFDIWAYFSSSPRLSFGIGIGGGNVGGGAIVGTGGHDDEATRVVFKDGLVVSVERNVSK